MIVVAFCLIFIGLVLCFVGKFPGQTLSYAGMLIAYFASDMPYSVWLLIVCGILVVASIYVNKTYVPKLAGMVHEFDKVGKIGTIVGSILAMLCMLSVQNFFVIVLLLLALPYAFAFLFEYLSTKDASEGAKRAVGAYIVYLASTLLNVAICSICVMAASGRFN